MSDNKIKNDKVFFIISNQSKLDDLIEYSLSKSNGLQNFNSILKKTAKYKREDFTTYVFYFDIFPNELTQILYLKKIKIILFMISNSRI